MVRRNCSRKYRDIVKVGNMLVSLIICEKKSQIYIKISHSIVRCNHQTDLWIETFCVICILWSKIKFCCFFISLHLLLLLNQHCWFNNQTHKIFTNFIAIRSCVLNNRQNEIEYSHLRKMCLHLFSSCSLLYVWVDWNIQLFANVYIQHNRNTKKLLKTIEMQRGHKAQCKQKRRTQRRNNSWIFGCSFKRSLVVLVPFQKVIFFFIIIILLF